MPALARRFVHSVTSLLFISFLCFALMRAAPGDYFSELRLEAGISQQTVQAMERETDLQRPLLARYLSWCSAILQGDFGVSLTYHLPVATLIKSRIGKTLTLGTMSLALAWALGLIGGWMTGWPSTPVRMIAAAFWSIPEPLLAIIALVVALRFQVLGPITSGPDDMSSFGTWIRTEASRIALPAITLALGYFPVVLRHVQRGLEAARKSPQVEAAVAHGFSRHRIWFGYLLPEAANPLISLLGLGIGSLLSSSLFVEVLFGWPGLGQLLLNAILARDTNVVVAGVLCSAVMLITGNLVADILLWLHDPRLRSNGLEQ